MRINLYQTYIRKFHAVRFIVLARCFHDFALGHARVQPRELRVQEEPKIARGVSSKSVLDAPAPQTHRLFAQLIRISRTKKSTRSLIVDKLALTHMRCFDCIMLQANDVIKQALVKNCKMSCAKSRVGTWLELSLDFCALITLVYRKFSNWSSRCLKCSSCSKTWRLWSTCNK